MNSILMVTPLYPLPTKENNCTFVCHYFTREWVKIGYNVVVIHVQPVHCRAWHFIVKLFGKTLNNVFGGGNFYARRITQTEHYIMDGVPVYRVPVFNIIPRGRYPKRSIDKLVEEVDSTLADLKFSPDVIVGHMTPIEIIPEINMRYHAKTCMVEHSVDKKLKKRYKNWEELIDSYDSYGFRAKSIRNEFELEYKTVNKPFYCYSGIPTKYLIDQNLRVFSEPLSSFLFIGDLMERKYPITLLEAIPQVINGDYNITYVGDGKERSRLERYVDEKGLNQHVNLAGRVPRDKVANYFDKADCFIMVSRNEAYGLVYLEAMARGCITIASRNEGFDGVIVDGYNGFLCEAGDANELAQVIRRINNLSSSERRRISNNGLLTARRMTDDQVAKQYVEHLNSI